MAQMNDVNMDGVEGSMSGGGIIPADMYTATITKSERKKTKDQQSEMLVLTFTVQRGVCKGRSVILRLNLWNKNAQTREIAKSEYQYLLNALGMPKGVQDSQDLHNLPVLIQVIVDEYEKTNPRTREVEVKKSNSIIDYGSVKSSGAQLEEGGQNFTPTPGGKPWDR